MCIRDRAGEMRIEYNRCVFCFCCQEVCPHAAVKVKKGILMKIISGAYNVYSHHRMGK
jgi:formate hydrogenlyase subunit 6/NADH:ubiquinone oxidoreductase subunit I